MATIKSFTDISQGRKLAEILPLESADMYYEYIGIPVVNVGTSNYNENGQIIPCWSLAALLDVLPNENILVKTTDSEYYCIAKDIMTKHYNNPVDALYELILKLYELNLL